MKKICDYGKYGTFRIEKSVARQLQNNGIYFPNIDKVSFFETEDDQGSKVLKTCVWFSDGTISTVKNCKMDKPDRELGVVYAVIKRLFGVVGNDGIRTDGTGVMGYLRDLVETAQDQNKIREDRVKFREQKKAENLARQKEIRENAEKRREDKNYKREDIDALINLLKKINGSSDKSPSKKTK